MLRLMEVLLHGGSQLAGWRTAQLYTAVLEAFGMIPTAYSLTQLRYDMRKLRAHGLLERQGRSYSYRLTTKGVKVAALFVLSPERENLLLFVVAQDVAHGREGTCVPPYKQDSQQHAPAVRAAAMHEAGHAVAAIVLKLEVRYVILHYIRTTRRCSIGGYTGTAFAGRATPEQTRAAYNSPEMLRVRAVQTLAGPATEWLARGALEEGDEDAHAEDVDHGAEDDDRRVVALAVQAVGPVEYRTCYESWNEEAHRLVRAHFAACFAVAEYLFTHPNQQMPGTLVKQLMAQHVLNDGQEKGGA